MSTRYFVVARFGRWTHPDVRTSVREPASRCHAKEMGTNTTQCGVPCDSWERFWDHPFGLPSDDVCEQCAAAIGLPVIPLTPH